MIDTIIDLHAGRGMPEDMATVKAAGVTHIIHKATQGVSYTDEKYTDRRTAAVAEGIRWGAYHFGDSSDPKTQAEHFLEVAAVNDSTLVALDLEHNPDGGSMTLYQAITWLVAVQQALKRWPVLYTGYYVLQDLGWTGLGLPSNCPLWIAAYGESALIPKGWPDYTLHQYTDGSQGGHPWRFPSLTNAYDRSRANAKRFPTMDIFNQWWENSTNGPNDSAST